MVAKDKVQHFVACGAVAAAAAYVAAVSDCKSAGAIGAGTIGGTACGLGKEYGDKVCKDNFWDWTDVWADVAGAVAGSIVGTIAGVLTRKFIMS